MVLVFSQLFCLILQKVSLFRVNIDPLPPKNFPKKKKFPVIWQHWSRHIIIYYHGHNHGIFPRPWLEKLPRFIHSISRPGWQLRAWWRVQKKRKEKKNRKKQSWTYLFCALKRRNVLLGLPFSSSCYLSKILIFTSTRSCKLHMKDTNKGNWTRSFSHATNLIKR